MSLLLRSDIPGQRTAPRPESPAAGPATAAGMTILSTGVWPQTDADIEPPGVAGFIVSSFSPLAIEVAARAMDAAPPVGAVTAVMVVSTTGDVVSAGAVAAAVDAGTRVGPLMFFQSVPNAVAGYIAVRWSLTGPVVAISPAGESALAEAFDAAGLLFDDGDAEQALLIFVEQATGPDDHDRALALLVERSNSEPSRHGARSSQQKEHLA